MGLTPADMFVNPTTSEKNTPTSLKASGGTGLPCRTTLDTCRYKYVCLYV